MLRWMLDFSAFSFYYELMFLSTWLLHYFFVWKSFIGLNISRQIFRRLIQMRPYPTVKRILNSQENPHVRILSENMTKLTIIKILFHLLTIYITVFYEFHHLNTYPNKTSSIKVKEIANRRLTLVCSSCLSCKSIKLYNEWERYKYPRMNDDTPDMTRVNIVDSYLI